MASAPLRMVSIHGPHLEVRSAGTPSMPADAPSTAPMNSDRVPDSPPAVMVARSAATRSVGDDATAWAAPKNPPGSCTGKGGGERQRGGMREHNTQHMPKNVTDRARRADQRDGVAVVHGAAGLQGTSKAHPHAHGMHAVAVADDPLNGFFHARAEQDVLQKLGDAFAEPAQWGGVE